MFAKRPKEPEGTGRAGLRWRATAEAAWGGDPGAPAGGWGADPGPPNPVGTAGAAPGGRERLTPPRRPDPRAGRRAGDARPEGTTQGPGGKVREPRD